MVSRSRWSQFIVLAFQSLAFSFECARKTRRAVVKRQIIITMSSNSVDNLANKDIPQPQTSVKSDTHQLFGRFRISSNQIFHRTIHTFALVNLRPIVPGHVLVCSNRVIPLLSDLEDEEYEDLWKSVRIVQQVLKHQYNCDAFNIAVQDGKGAGQSVPHVHVHILPRYVGDFERNDDIYDQLEEWAPRGNNTSGEKPKLHSERKERTVEEMAEEAAIYKRIISRLST